LSTDIPLGTDAHAYAVAVAEPTPARRACVVRLGGRPFAVDVVDAREVVVVEMTTPVPGAPATVIGVTNLRGSVLAVVEVRPLLGLPVPPASGPLRALVIADGDHRAAMLIDRVVGLAAFDDIRHPLVPCPPGSLLIGHLVDEAGEQVAVLDTRALLAAVRATWVPDGLSRVAVPRTSGA
jgi:purine-binding chemotaxis protein CheW